MNRIVGVDTPLYALFRRWYASWLLGAFWLMGCLPVVTFFASTAAAFATAVELRETDELPSCRRFAGELCRCFVPATLSGLPIGLVASLLGCDVLVALRSPTVLMAVSFCVTGPLLLCTVAAATVYFATLARSRVRGESPRIRGTVRLSLQLVGRHPLLGLATVAAAAACVCGSVMAPLITQPIAALTLVGFAFRLVSVIVSRMVEGNASAVPMQGSLQ